jgi:ATP-dependent Clp protease ATP-binding subunit ClpC
MTSNVGADLIRKSTEIGFGAREGVLEYSAIKEKIEGAMKKTFKPEFLNRISDIVIFKPLSKESLKNIVDLEMKKLSERLVRKEIFINLSEDAKNFLVDHGYEPEMGARPLRRAMEEYIEDRLSELILQRPDQSWRSDVLVEGDKLQFIDRGETNTKPPVPPVNNDKARNTPVKQAS